MAKKTRTGVLIILDGFGDNPNRDHNAVLQAKTPTLDYLMKTYPHSRLDASESHVGLPNGFMGNSEVGHLNLGAGRVVYQDFSLISRAISEGGFFENPALAELMQTVAERRDEATLHLMGLVSDGGVHSHLSHGYALLEMAKRRGISRVALHAFTDGRDTNPTSGVDFVGELASFCRDLGLGSIQTVSGRFYAMDRDSRWERTARAFDAVVSGKAPDEFSDPVEYVRAQYETGVTDEFLPPAVRRGYRGIQDGDGVIFFNFRADRARQITRAITQADFTAFPRSSFPTLTGFVTMTRYDESFPLRVAYEKAKVPNTLGELVSGKGWKQLRIAETEKYAHVTYFFNGGEERVFEGEKRVLVPSPREVKTYDLKPEMSAPAVTDALMKELQTGEYAFVVVNFANCDMVGHTGNLSAAVRAVEAVDSCLARVVDWIETEKAFGILTSDHGNCEQMADEQGRPLTSHTLRRVPFVVLDPRKEVARVHDGKLSDVAPTLLALWGEPQPAEMTGKNLVELKS